jgi:hypothetical protein
MASGMSAARLQVDPELIVEAYEYDKNTHRAVQCLDCGCAVIGVRSTTRNVGDHQIPIHAYFRLPTDALKNGQAHREGCRFNVESTISLLVARSAEVKTFDSEAEPLLSAFQGKRAELRLHILTEIVRSKPSEHLEGAFGKEILVRHLGKRYTVSRRLLSGYLTVTEAILSLVGWVQKRSDLAAWIELKHGSHRISWKRFFFDLGHYRELYDQLMEQGESQKGTGHPIAMVVEFKDQSLTKATIHGNWPLRGRNPTEKSEGLAIIPRLFVSDEKLAREMLKERFILVFAVAKLGRRQDAPKPWFNLEVELQLTINHRAQFCRYNPT